MRVPDLASFQRGSRVRGLKNILQNGGNSPIIQSVLSNIIAAAYRGIHCGDVAARTPPNARKNISSAHLITASDRQRGGSLIEAPVLSGICGIDGGYDICAEMYNKSILVPLRIVRALGIHDPLSQYLDGPQNALENAQKLVHEFADNLIIVLWCLSETSTKSTLVAIRRHETNTVPHVLLVCARKIPLAPVTAAAQCLYVLTDDNYPAIAGTSAPTAGASHASCLSSNPDENSVTMPNGKSADVPRPAGELNARMQASYEMSPPIPPPSAASAIDVDKDIVLPQLQPDRGDIPPGCVGVRAPANIAAGARYAFPFIHTSIYLFTHTRRRRPRNIEKLSPKNTPKSDHKSSAEIELERLEGRLRTVQLALEILTGACATLPDPEPEATRRPGKTRTARGRVKMAMKTLQRRTATMTSPCDIDMAVDRDEDGHRYAHDVTNARRALPRAHPTHDAFPSHRLPRRRRTHPRHPPSAQFTSLRSSASTTSSSPLRAPPPRVAVDGFWDRSAGARCGEVAVGVQRRCQRLPRELGPQPGARPSPDGVLRDSASGSGDTGLAAKDVPPARRLQQVNATIATRISSPCSPARSTPASPAGTEPMLAGTAASPIGHLLGRGRGVGREFSGRWVFGVWLAGVWTRRKEGGEGDWDRRKEGVRELEEGVEEVRDNLVAFIKYRNMTRGCRHVIYVT
ncbi:ARM repeat-containing protein [Mycena venus]|uniref:ARM repeat-containing protein n=1 Tax=Mycena venus TaxID=2733690 RepID=A0A8H6X577_9AGAR|nr:ARM repeat-containing protein [Mycena venus]